jgi:hypothetical protein
MFKSIQRWWFHHKLQCTKPKTQFFRLECHFYKTEDAATFYKYWGQLWGLLCSNNKLLRNTLPSRQKYPKNISDKVTNMTTARHGMEKVVITGKFEFVHYLEAWSFLQALVVDIHYISGLEPSGDLNRIFPASKVGYIDFNYEAEWYIDNLDVKRAGKGRHPMNARDKPW